MARGRLKKRLKSEIPPCVLRSSRPVIVGRAVTNQVLGPRPSGHFSSFSLPRSHPYRSSSAGSSTGPRGPRRPPCLLGPPSTPSARESPSSPLRLVPRSLHSLSLSLSLFLSCNQRITSSWESLPLKHLSQPPFIPSYLYT